MHDWNIYQFEFFANGSRQVDRFSVDTLDGYHHAAIRANLSEHLTQIKVVLWRQRRRTRPNGSWNLASHKLTYNATCTYRNAQKHARSHRCTWSASCICSYIQRNSAWFVVKNALPSVLLWFDVVSDIWHLIEAVITLANYIKKQRKLDSARKSTAVSYALVYATMFQKKNLHRHKFSRTACSTSIFWGLFTRNIQSLCEANSAET